MKPVRIALIGCGFIAEKHVRAISEIGAEAKLVALCDIDQERLNSFRDRIGMSNNPCLALYTNFDECLRSNDIDLVVIASSTDTHAQLSLAALRSGHHVLVEKPLALSISDARKVAEEAERSGKILAVSLQTRYLPQLQAMKKCVDEGRFGKMVHAVVSMRWNRNLQYYHSSPWRNSWPKGGGLFINQCIHYIDLLQWLLGRVTSVYAAASTIGQPLQVENMGTAILHFENGATGLIEASSIVYPRSLLTSISLFGDKGTVSLEGDRLSQFSQWIFEADKDKENHIPHTAEISYTPLYKDLIHAIQSNTSPLVSVKSSLHSLEVVLAIYKSIKEGAPVGLPLDSFDLEEMNNNKGGQQP
ncbi:Gfo/Idh/MocA family protein [Paenibacillus silviterrae]|uniref:Gfo/Idh/MocA family protein n=1 Tax=Paenibacillus silviterrae TaxID=3242194 RepID=UPI002543C4F0|nr:Gfo/Idh/MocA family oxidoreductase [Paenibacillus chinjuensis]